jgi:uridylate kinase|tara:strand:- start:296 stop:982 length:687 start_codon:yes stop_codon:yes gene_type:complete
MKKVIVISLGGSIIIPDKIDVKFLKEFKRTIKKNTKKYKFVIVCGGGSIARKYISALKEEKISEKFQSFSGISATRMNARFMSHFFNQDPKKGIPMKMKEVKKYLEKQDIVFCGALEYKPEQTSDSTSAEIAENLKTIFINLTVVPNLYDKNPKEFKNAKVIPEITWNKFNKMANKIKFKPGQHFILDQTAAKIILKSKIKTYILGKDLRNLDNVLNGKKFKGTIISN